MAVTTYAVAIGVGLSAAYIGAGLGARRRRGWSEIYAVCVGLVLWTMYACSATLYNAPPGRSRQAAGFFLLQLAFAGLTFAFPASVLAAIALDTRARRRTELEPQPVSKLAWPLAQLLTVLSVGVIGVATYAHEVEPLALKVTQVQLRTRKLRGAERPVRIVHITDIHLEPTRISRAARARLTAKCYDLQPDILLWGGDYVNTHDEVPLAQKLIVELSGLASLGAYAVVGDWRTDNEVLAFAEGTEGAPRVLTNQHARVSARGGDLYVVGLPFSHPEPNLPEAEEGLPDEAFRVLLAHSPPATLPARGYDLIVCGHTHGGQLRLPWPRRLARHFGAAPYTRGRYEHAGQLLYVNSGVGMEGGPAPRLRLCSPPEILVVDVVGTAP